MSYTILWNNEIQKGSPNPGHKTRSSVNKKKRISSEFGRSNGPVKEREREREREKERERERERERNIKEIEKIPEYLDLA